MPPPSPAEASPLHSRSVTQTPRQLLARAACGLTVLLSLSVLAGWALDVPTLRSVTPGAVEMKVNTAAGLLLVAAALWAASGRPSAGVRRLVAVLSACVVVLGAATLSEYAFGWNLNIDELLANDTGAVFNQFKGRMSPYSALAFIALGSATAALPYRRAAMAVRTAAAVALALGIVSFLGYLWNASEIVTDRLAPPVAVNTAWALILLGTAIFLLSQRSNDDATARPRSRLESLLLSGFIPTVLFVVTGGGFTYTAETNFAQTSQLVAHTQEVRATLGQLYGAIADAELAQRNLALTGNPLFQDEFTARSQDANNLLRTLQHLISDNPQQTALHARLANLAGTHLAALARVGEQYRANGFDGARRALLADAGEHTMLRVQGVTREMDEAEVALADTRVAKAQSARQTTLVSLLAILIALTLLFLLLFRSIRREVLARNAAERHLEQLNAGLEQRVAERTQALDFQQAFLRRVMDANRSLIFAKDSNGRFVLVNQAMADVYGSSVEALVGQQEDAFPHDKTELEGFRDADRQVISSGRELVVAEEKLTLATGEVRWFSTVKRPLLSPDGASTILLGVSHDITDRKAAEDLLRQLTSTLERRVEQRTLALRESNENLVQARLESEAANRAKSAFLANMSHEIRTPMNAVIGLAHLMLRDSRDSLQRDRLGKVSAAAHHLLQVINDILDISKIEAGKLTLDDIEFSLDAVLSEATQMVSTRAGEKGLELIVDTDHLPDRLRGDPTRLSQILINLLSNAVKFTEHGWVRLRGELVSEEGTRLQVRFEVQDTGVGIASDRQASLFTAFEQADSSTSRRHGGTGLGLALSRQLARAMGGEAGAVSAPGAGSTFWFTAWLAHGLEAVPQVEPVSLQGLRALLVDDLPEALSVITERLQRMGMVVDAHDSGPGALRKVEAEMAASRPYDVMLVDWRMEPMDGIETMTQLRALLGDGLPPSILITAFDDPALVRRAAAAHFDAVLLKPITSSALHDQLSSMLGRRGFPLSRPPEASTSENLVRLRHAGRRVLVAEDNPVNREVADALLQMAGLVVETAPDGARAVELALSRPYDIVLMDVQMPVMDGLDASRAIRAQVGRRLPIIAMTANAFSEDRQACLDAGMNDHVPKPVDAEQMYATLLRWLPLQHDAEATVSAPALPGHDGTSGRAPLPDRLAAIEGFDVDVAMHQVAGQVTILERALTRFVETYREGLPELLAETGDEQEATARRRRACHSIRGALSTIGAAALIEQVTALERAMAGGAAADLLFAQGKALHESLLQFVQDLQAALVG